MEIKSLVIDRHALHIIDSAYIEAEWFEAFHLPPGTENLKRVQIGETIYILSEAADTDGLLVVKVGTGGVFNQGPKSTSVFEKIIRIALRQFDRTISIPALWQPYREGSLLSLFAENFSKKGKHRIYFDSAPLGTSNIYAFAVTDGVKINSSVDEDLSIYTSAIDGFIEAALQESANENVVGNYGIHLSQSLENQLVFPGTLQEWLDKLLTEEQLRFVNKGLDSPIRLRGAAGTGKTQAMAVKCLHEIYEDVKIGGDKSFAFITHSSALAHNVIRDMFYALDPSGRWSELKTSDGNPKIRIGTLYEFAQQQLNYEKKGLKPISLDGQDGREYQKLLIQQSLEQILKDPRIALGLLKNSKIIVKKLYEPELRSQLIDDLMNEFSCTLDAENIRKGSTEAEKYIKAVRDDWQMDLSDAVDRELVVEIHDAYRKNLKKEHVFSLDQMIADLSQYLLTHEWDQLRERDGFDLIFVDEYHYFNKLEAMSLQYLFKSRAERSGRWPLIMAYDLKQSTNDAGLGGGLARFKNPGVGPSVPVDLSQVFRYTPQIADFLRDLDGAFPAIDLEGEFKTHIGQSNKEDGDIPLLATYKTSISLIDDVFDKASREIRISKKSGSQVAVLCLNSELFEKYLNAGRIRNKFIPVKSREDLKELRYARSRCIFSMPEYVAGLQFDTVFLIHADEVDLTSELISQGARRRYVSRVYLGASRAVKTLILSCAEDRGGVSPILRGPIKNQSLISVSA